MWLAVAGGRAVDAARFLELRARAGLSEVELAAADHVVDLDAEELSCPACGATFANDDPSRCPDCGLRLG